MPTDKCILFNTETRFIDEEDLFMNHYLSVHVARQVRSVRELRGWTAAEFARRLETSARAVANLENPTYGRSTVPTLLNVAQAFDLALLVQFVTTDHFLAVVRAGRYVTEDGAPCHWSLLPAFVARHPDAEARTDFVRKRLIPYVTDEIAYEREQLHRDTPNAHSFSLGAFAESLGVSKQNAARIEDPAYGRWTTKTLVQVADMLGLLLMINFVDYATFIWAVNDTTVMDEYLIETDRLSALL